MYESIKSTLSRYPAVYEPLRKALNRYRNLKIQYNSNRRLRKIQKQIWTHIRHKNSVFFVQVGSNDGFHGDPIRDLVIKNTNWKGIFIEPIPFLFERLKQNYNNSERFIFEKIAISTQRGFQKFYYVCEEAKTELGGLPEWYDQLGSFDRNHILKHLQGKLEPYIIEEDIETITMQEIFDRNNVEAIDLLHIDTEGFDYKVLSQVDFLRYKPCVIMYEQKHLSNDEKKLAKSLLEKYNYNYLSYGGDILAFING
ncbi:FkbM family methyltransferase [Okeania sp. KiyG1]|uniref:FkbM family methyltransferase n=1 Tax=Okeania sp. KiyG1 TaxID=2720165 RepID=UPI00192111F1|nr:FkbM family methyltransferase [Okeania sp. KiyG1]GGA33418.1 hypothetical protein CYANOKiyG1_50430 [Okeania sp. KiyG1]